ncbi:MAG: helicase, partial [Verrucomicrobia bacterium]|nr:helicase [Verrucomicrobiota bacterium]
AQDRALYREAEALAEGEVPAMLVLTTAQVAGLLPKLVGHPRISVGKQAAVEVSKQIWRATIKATLEPKGEIVLSAGTMPGDAALLTSGTQSWVFQKNKFQPVVLPPALLAATQGSVRLKRSEVPIFLTRDWPQLQAACEVQSNFKLEDFSCEASPPKFLLHLHGGLAQLHGQLQCAYGVRIHTVGKATADDGMWQADPDSPTRYITRDTAAEKAALDRLLKYGFSRPDELGMCHLVGEDRVLNFMAREYPRIEKEWKVSLEERLQRSTEKNLERIEPEFRVMPSGERWFDLEVSFAGESERFSAMDIQRLLLSGRNHTRLKNGKIALIDTEAIQELQQVLQDVSPEQQGGKYRINNAQAGFLQSSLDEAGLTKLQAPPTWQAKAFARQGVAEMPLPAVGELEKVLRPYQKQGVAWLWFLRQNQFGGILADEMGLGKTLQTLALLVAAKNEAKLKPVLIVCPTSLVFNWVQEAKKFAPQLKVLALDGPQRQARFPLIAESDLIVTSYALIRRDAELYRQHEFDTVILDEAQHIKNRESQNAQAVKTIRADNRLVLTGTPMENSVLDLWSIFDFLMPGYLGVAKDFRERYEMPIVRDKDKDAQARLTRRLKPFILRRLKRDVAKELPEKLEQVSFCELTEEQQAAYTQILEASRKEVLEAVGAQGLAKSRMVIFSALLRLRQICCDVRLLKLPDAQIKAPSGKLEMFGELLEEIIDGGHRALVFSQFVEMLTLLREKLDKDGVKYCYLDGSTKNRGEVVEQFQKTNDIPLFLISLKAGGTGLNLTAADTVIHFDPWWNPAVEDQATGRAHRIGQNRVVTSYKLIARGTLEEKILSLQQRKREMAEATLDGEEAFSNSLTWDEIQGLFAS